MNNVQKGYHRDREIVNLVESKKALNTDQIVALIFPHSKYGLRKCQERLTILSTGKNKKLNRIRLSLGMPNIYYIDRKNIEYSLEHLIELNWVYVWAWYACQVNKFESIYFWGYEQQYKTLRADALLTIYNTVKQELDFWFIELDHSVNNPFDKVSKYNKFYETEEYSGAWWVRHAKKFPGVMVVTVDQKRKEKIKKAIRDENRNNLRFDVRLVDDLIRQVVTWKG